MSTACVSHEMRNPLNSICGMNNLKKDLYLKIRQARPSQEVLDLLDDLD